MVARTSDAGVPAALLPVGRVAAALGVGTRHVYKLVARGTLPPPEQIAGRNVWALGDVEAARVARANHRPRNRHRMPSAQSTMRRLVQDRATLARAFLNCWQRCGLHLALDVVRRHGALEGPLDLDLEQLARCTAELEASVRVVRGLR